ncbi:MAG: hypothetical protein DRK00_01245 [Thermoprotei archaeon]|nr:MAG: hypothetical protein DRK00_01245 [Thermoprotei archaeon]
MGAEEVVASDVAAELAELSEGGYGLIVVEGCEDYRLRDLKYRRPIPLVVSMPALRIKSWRSTRVS